MISMMVEDIISFLVKLGNRPTSGRGSRPGEVSSTQKSGGWVPWRGSDERGNGRKVLADRLDWSRSHTFFRPTLANECNIIKYRL